MPTKKSTTQGALPTKKRTITKDAGKKQQKKRVLELGSGSNIPDAVMLDTHNSLLGFGEQAKTDPNYFAPIHDIRRVEVINFIEDQQLGYHLGNSVMYISRAKQVGLEYELQSLEAAKWHIQRVIDNIKGR